MDLILEHPPRSYWLQVIDDVSEFESPFAGAPYPCLIWDARGSRSVAELSRLSGALVASGLRYAVCGGVQCSRWHDAIDQTFIELELDGEEYESRFVMTSWHTDKSPDDVAFFFVYNTNFDRHDFTRYLVLMIDADPGVEQPTRPRARGRRVRGELVGRRLTFVAAAERSNHCG